MSSARTTDRALLLAGIVLLLGALMWLTCLLAPADGYRAREGGVALPTEAHAPQIEPVPAIATGAEVTPTSGAAGGAESESVPWHSDVELGVSQPGMALRRVVQMLQWREVATVPLAPGDEVLVDQGEYQMVWASEPIDSALFAEPQGHENPPMPSYRSRLFGEPPERIVDSDQPAPQWQPIPAAQIQLPDNLAATFRIDEPWLVTAAASAAPEAGDWRLRYEVLEAVGAAGPDRPRTDSAEAHSTDRTDRVATGRALGWIMRIGALLLAVIAAGLALQGLRRLLPATSWLARASGAARFTLALWCTVACLLLAALLARLV